ncbi:hypothetical protein MMC21_000898 [Puttea exsequens]|nr:hypothetical protein [Puttea exsequens]
MKGFAKILESCKRALDDEYEYAWVDTCCINKESSAELSEAINSMYRWYRASAVCYAYLSDVQADALESDAVEQQIKSSVWFKRGWTLQELLAPPNVRFYDRQWKFMGTKRNLNKVLTLKTGIDEDILNGRELPTRRSIAQRMSWASERETTRAEDTAYCLLGIFDVNMPLLYGEGERAFLRLQEEIIKQSDDHTIFAWPINRLGQPGLLADNPSAFAHCQSTRAVNVRKGRAPYSMTNHGLSIKLLATPYTADTYLVRLDCMNELLPANSGSIGEYRLGMFLRRLAEDDQFARVKYNGQTFVQLHASTWVSMIPKKNFCSLSHLRPTRIVELIEINIRQHSTRFDVNNFKDRVNGFRIATPEIFEQTKSGIDNFKVSSWSWHQQERIMSMKEGEFGTSGTIDISQQNRKIKFIKLGFDFEFNPVCSVAMAGGLTQKEHVKDRNGMLNYGTEAQQAQWSPDEHMQFLAIHQRTPFDSMAWSEIQHNFAIELKHHPGLWALKGDRINGLDVRLGELASLRILRGTFHEQIVWDVCLDIEKPKDSTFRKIFK